MLAALLIAVTVVSLAAASYFKDSAETASRTWRAARNSPTINLNAIGRTPLRPGARPSSSATSRFSSRRALALDKGIALAEAGHADRGLLWMLEALKTAPEDAIEFRRMVRWNLGAWLGQVHKPLRFIDTGVRCGFVGFSKDGRSLATGSKPTGQSLATPIEFWDTATGAKLRPPAGIFAPIAFRRDGRVLVATTADQGRMLAVDLATGGVLWTTPKLPGTWGRMIDFSPDGTTVLADRYDKTGDAWIVQLDVFSGQSRGEPMRGRGSVAVAPDHKWVATGRVENGEASIDLLELPSGRRTASWRAGGQDIFSLHISPDGKSLYGSQRIGGLVNTTFGQIWNAGDGRPTSALMNNTTAALYAPSADRLLTLSDNLWLVRGADGRVRGSGLSATDSVSHSAICGRDPDGRLMIAASSSSMVGLWEMSPEAEPVADGDTGRLTSTAELVAKGRSASPLLANGV